MLVLLAAILPGLFWERGPETAPELKRAGVEKLYVAAKQAPGWQGSGLDVTPLDEAAIRRFEKVKPPAVQWRMNVASATRQPWIDANGWRFERNPKARYWYDVPAGAADLAAAEAFAYSVDALLKIDPGDLEAYGRMLAFLREVDGPDVPPLANVCVADDGSPAMGEALLMLARRNLPFRITRKAAEGCEVFLPRDPAAIKNPAAFATKVRGQLTDEKRLVRIFGAETVIVRPTGAGGKARLHILNYSDRRFSGLRVRMRGEYKRGTIRAASVPESALADFTVENGAVEFTVTRMGRYAVVDLE